MSLFVDEYKPVTFPVLPKLFSKADPVISRLTKPSQKEIYDNRVSIAAYYYLVERCTFYIEEGWCTKTNEELRIHHCIWQANRYEIAVMNGALDRKHKNFKRVDKVCICAIENRYVN